MERSAQREALHAAGPDEAARHARDRALGQSLAGGGPACPICTETVDLKSRHVIVEGSAIRLFCSPECRDAALLGEEIVSDAPAPPPARRRRLYPLALAGVPLGAVLVLQLRAPAPENRPWPSFLDAVAAATASPSGITDEPEPELEPYGPAWPPTEEQWRAVLSREAWIHPLSGPERRMPLRDSRVFGAVRPGDRPAECNSGHCGVDIGHTWGEPVHAVSDGVVVRVQRGPNEDRGGLYVRLSHRNGTIFTQYFHLAAIPRSIQVGAEVKAGEIIGLVGDTGVKSSGPHLHFTIAVKPSPDVPTRYIDPEPLIALWPVHVPVGTGVGMPAPDIAPGLVRGANTRRPRPTPRPAPAPDEAATAMAPADPAAPPIADHAGPF